MGIRLRWPTVLASLLADGGLAGARGAGVVVAVGSGTICDIGKEVTRELAVPYVVVQTANSVNASTNCGRLASLPIAANPNTPVSSSRNPRIAGPMYEEPSL